MTMQKIFKVSALSLLTTLAVTTEAASLKAFKAGEVIKASEMNGNFSYLKSLLDASGVGKASETVAIDCGSDPAALTKYLASPSAAAALTLNLSGACSGNVVVQRDRITLKGGGLSGNVVVSGAQGVVFSGVNFSSGANKSLWIKDRSQVTLTNVSLPEGVRFDDDRDGDELWGPEFERAVLHVTGSIVTLGGISNTINLVATHRSSVTLTDQDASLKNLKLTESTLEYPNALTTELALVAFGSRMQGKTANLGGVSFVLNSSGWFDGNVQAEGLYVGASASVIVGDSLTLARQLEISENSLVYVSNNLTATQGDGEIYLGEQANLEVDDGDLNAKQVEIERLSSADVGGDFIITGSLDVDSSTLDVDGNATVAGKAIFREIKPTTNACDAGFGFGCP